jgi:hypothetical protein
MPAHPFAASAEQAEKGSHESCFHAAQMLSEDEVFAMETWVRAASGWSEAAQVLVAAASRLALESRDLANRLDPPGIEERLDAGRPGLATQLVELATTVESDASTLRDRYLETAANIELYRDVLN